MLLKAGDKTALSTWWKQNGNQIACSVARGILKHDPRLQEDAVQDTFLKVFHKVTGNPQTGKPGEDLEFPAEYTKTVAQTTSIDLSKKQQSHTGLSYIEDWDIDSVEQKASGEPSLDESIEREKTQRLEKLKAEFTRHLERTPDDFIMLLESTQDDAFLLWYLKRIKRKTLEELTQLDARPLNTISKAVTRFEENGLLELMRRWSFREVVSLLESLCDCKRSQIQHHGVAHHIGQFLQTPTGYWLYKYFYGEQLSPRSKKDANFTDDTADADDSGKNTLLIDFLKKRPKFQRTAGTLLWLAHYTSPSCSWPVLAEQWEMDADALERIAQATYPHILQEYRIYRMYERSLEQQSTEGNE